MALHKEIRIQDRLRFNFQAEFLNFMNHPVFGAGSYNIDSQSFGPSGTVVVNARNISFEAISFGKPSSISV